MIQNILKKPMFNIGFSFLLGLGIIAMFRPLCKDITGKPIECTKDKAPVVKDWEGAVYRIGSKCYEYKTQTIECPKDKGTYIESFRSDFSARNSILTNAP